MTERQEHGFKFEDWVRQEVFGLMPAPRDANKWDVEAQDNRLDGLLVSIKCIEWKRSIYLGDMVRQFNINTDFRLIVGFWKGRKDIVQVVDCVIRQQD